MEEVWKLIAKYNGHYSVSETGKVRSVKGKSLKTLSACKTKNGFLAVCLSYQGKTKLERVHRLVAESFIYNPNPSDLKYVRHINGDLLDNRVANLQWVRHRKQKKEYPALGEDVNYFERRRYEQSLMGKEPSTFTSTDVARIKYYWKQGWGLDTLVLFFGGTYPEVRRIAYNQDYRQIKPAP